MKITFDLLQILDAIDRHGSFTAAASALHRVPSALSHAVGKLEDELGVTLFERVGRRTVLDIVGRQGGYGVEEKVAPARWHTLRVEFTAARCKVFFNGKLLFELEDRTFCDAGEVGLWTKADSVTCFDDFKYGAK